MSDEISVNQEVFFLRNLRDSIIYQLLCELVTSKNVYSSVYGSCIPVLLTLKVVRSFSRD